MKLILQRKQFEKKNYEKKRKGNNGYAGMCRGKMNEERKNGYAQMSEVTGQEFDSGNSGKIGEIAATSR